MIQFLFSQNSNPLNLDKKKRSLLHLITQIKNLDLDSFQTILFAAKSNFSTKDIERRTAMHLLCESNHLNKEKLLLFLEMKPNLNENDQHNPLHYLINKCKWNTWL